MKRYRKLPVVIEAERVTIETFHDIADWCGGRAIVPSDVMDSHIIINTLEGDMMAGLGDWIIKGVNGEFYPIKNNIFEATYEPVDD